MLCLRCCLLLVLSTHFWFIIFTYFRPGAARWSLCCFMLIRLFNTFSCLNIFAVIYRLLFCVYQFFVDFVVVASLLFVLGPAHWVSEALKPWRRKLKDILMACLSLSLSIYIYILYTRVYIYIYIEREREREMCVYIYIHIYIYIYVRLS